MAKVTKLNLFVWWKEQNNTINQNFITFVTLFLKFILHTYESYFKPKSIFSKRTCWNV